MRIAIHDRKGSFSEKWINYCEDKGVSYKIVNCYDNDIILQLRDCDALMWHYSHIGKEHLFAKQILMAAEHSGLKVFPNFFSGWHYDDKIGQKYLLETLPEIHIPTYIFYDKLKALRWAENATYPKVFKLRNGAGSMNVELVTTKRRCNKIIKRAFGRGFSQFNKISAFKDHVREFSRNKSYMSLVKGVGRLFVEPQYVKQFSREKGYVYFQEFLSNNSFDMRVIVIGRRAYGMKRFNREGDFRASGSNNYSYEALPKEVLEKAFYVSKKLKIQCAAFDFVYNHLDEPVIIELSFAFGTKGSSKCSGYWDDELNWYPGSFNPQGWMVEDLLEEIESN